MLITFKRASGELNNPILENGQYCSFDPNLNEELCQTDAEGSLQKYQNYAKIATVAGIAFYVITCGTTT